jgi:cobalt-zinc-cadmium efflux system outer membrane protein
LNNPPPAGGGIQDQRNSNEGIAWDQSNQAPSAYSRFVDQSAGLSAGDLVNYALKHNGELQAARQMIAEARGRLRQAGLKPNPMIEASGAQAVNTPDNNLMIGVELPLELHGRRQARVAVAEREVALREAEAADFERKLAAEVRTKYSEAIAAARKLKLAEGLLKFTGDSHRLIKARVDLGRTAPLEQSLASVEVNRIDALRIGSESRAEVATLELKALIGMQPDEPLRLRDAFDNFPQPLARDEAINLALKNRPDLAVARAAEALAEAQVEQARVEGRVDASVFSNYQRMNFGYDIRGFDDAGRLVPITGVFHYLAFGVRLSLPTRNKNQGAIEAAVAALEAARARREFAERAARNEVTAAYAKFERARQALAVYRENVLNQAARNLDVIRQTYLLGQKTILDYLEEQRRFVEVETGFTELLKESFDSLVEIERVTTAKTPSA